MQIIKFIALTAAGSVLAALLLWISLAVGSAEPQRYLALARASCLLAGSLGVLIGTIFARPRIVLSALLLLAFGLASFWYQPC